MIDAVQSVVDWDYVEHKIAKKTTKYKTTKENYRLIKKTVAGKNVNVEPNIKSQHIWKRNQDNVQPTIEARKRRFNVIVSEKKEKR